MQFVFFDILDNILDIHFFVFVENKFQGIKNRNNTGQIYEIQNQLDRPQMIWDLHDGKLIRVTDLSDSPEKGNRTSLQTLCSVRNTNSMDKVQKSCNTDRIML